MNAVEEVAVLGDSQSTGTYGQRLSELIRFASKQRLSYFGAASSGRIDGWVNGGFAPLPAGAFFGCDAQTNTRSCAPQILPNNRTEAVATILSQHRYVDLYIITLGDNHFFDPASVRRELPRLVKPILSSGARCAFVTPTEALGQFADKRTLIGHIKFAVDSIEKDTGRTCTLVDSYTVGGDVLRNNNDLALMRDAVSADPMKLHPRGSGARLWAERVFETLVSKGLLSKL
jgi:hypothetical protein